MAVQAVDLRAPSGALLLALALALAACGRSPSAGGAVPATGSAATLAPTPAVPPEQPLVIIRDNGSFPPGCSPREVARFLGRFFDAFNRGDQQEFARFFGPDFKWFSDIPNPSGGSFVAHDRDAFLRYFAERHEQGDHMQLRMGERWPRLAWGS